MLQPVLYIRIAVQLLAMSLPILRTSSFGVVTCQYNVSIMPQIYLSRVAVRELVTRRVMAMAVPC
jgi:hypothetical protein